MITSGSIPHKAPTTTDIITEERSTVAIVTSLTATRTRNSLLISSGDIQQTARRGRGSIGWKGVGENTTGGEGSGPVGTMPGNKGGMGMWEGGTGGSTCLDVDKGRAKKISVCFTPSIT